MSQFQHRILSDDHTNQVVATLQQRLPDLVDLALRLKQAHWCVVGREFRTVHLQLDEILIDVRTGSDDVAERISTLGVAPDGLAQSVASRSRLEPMAVKFDSASNTIKIISQLLSTTITGLRESIQVVGELDPISEDLLIGLSALLEKHLWMVQAQEISH